MRQWTIDAFADRPFRGNPACVVEPFDTWPEADWMQALAQENNQAETAFLLRTAKADVFGLRWFTPAIEVPLCGHATLASAHMLFAEAGVAAEALGFDTQSGRLTISRASEAYVMDFPASPPRQTLVPEGLAAAIGVEPVEVWATRYLIAIVEDEATVRGLRPDLSALLALKSEAGHQGNLVVAALADLRSPYDVVSRFFAPGSGIAEDPTTGATHCMIAPVFSDKLHRAKLAYHQAFPGRGGDLTAEVKGDRVLLSGRAVTVAETTLRL